MAVEHIGIVKTLIGTATATSADGGLRMLHEGDRVYANDLIATADASVIVIEFFDGSRFDLGRNAQAVLDGEAFDPAAAKAAMAAAAAEAEAIQKAIAEGADPATVAKAPAAGEPGVEGNEGHTVVQVELTGEQVTPTSGFETEGLAIAFPERLEELLQDPQAAEVNADPLANDDAVPVGEDGPAVLIDVLANDSDADGDTLSVVAIDTDGTLGIVILNDDGTIQYDPNGRFDALKAGETATDTFTYTISDGKGGTSTATVTVTINGVNDTPQAADDVATVSADGPALAIDVLGNDTDPDGDGLNVSGVSTAGTQGSVTVNPDGTISYDPNGKFDALRAGETATDTFTYTASDGNGGTSAATVTVTITGINDAPDANDDTAVTTEDGPVRVIHVLDNDTDVEGDGLSILGVDTAGTKGTVTVNPDGTISYDPNGQFDALKPDQATTDTFTYTVSDGHGGEAVATVTVRIEGVNDDPVARPDSVTTTEDAPLDIVPSALLANDSDPEGDNLAVIHVDEVSAKGASITYDDATGKFVYDPAGKFDFLKPDQATTDTFTYRIGDGNGGYATATVTVRIEGVNDAPTANGDALATTEDTTATISLANLLANDTDPDGDTLAVVDFDRASANGGLISLNPATGSLTYNPNGKFDALGEGETAIDTFTYRISDGNGRYDVGTVTVTVNGVNDAPLADPVLTAAGAVPAGLDAALGPVVYFKALGIGGGLDGDIAVRESDPAGLGGADAETPESGLTFTLTSLPAFGSLYVDHGGADPTGGTWTKIDGANLATVSLTTADRLYWLATADDVAAGVTAGPTRLIGGLKAGLAEWNQFGVTIAAENFDGSPGALAFDRNGAGVEGGAPVTNQINFGNAQGESERFIVDFHNPVLQADVRISNLIPTEHGGEVGKVSASLQGVEVGAWTFSRIGSGAELEFDVDSDGVGWLNLPRDVIFDKLVFTATQYVDGQHGNDSSDYYVRAIEYVEGIAPPAPESVSFTYNATDGALTSSDVQVVIDMIGAPAAPQIGDAGDDILVYDPLASLIDGQGGFDTLRVDGDHDLVGNSAIRNIEALEIEHSGSAGSTVSLSLQDVINFTDGDNVLQVAGGSTDHLHIGNAGDWNTAVSDQAGYALYVAAAGDPVKLYVDDQVSVVTVS